MSHERSHAERRRRVLYSAHQASSTSASRREVERLRQARRPNMVYGSRVHRRLRARWFALVPVRRRALIAVAGSLSAATILLCIAHYAAVSWPAIAYRPEIARPLRLDRPDSFGRWFMVAMLTGGAGASLLIYQLRRYRNDDFAGRYRLWRTVLVVSMLASLNALVSMIDWGGALLDVVFGRRVALTGSDWIRLVVTFGGVVLSLQMLVELRRCRFAVAAFAVALACFAIPETANWNILGVNSMARWVLVTSAPLIGCTALFISLVVYLRMLYREARGINEGDSLRERLHNMRLRVSGRKDRDEFAEDSEEPAEERTRRRWRRRSDRVTSEDHTAVEEDDFEPGAAQEGAEAPQPRREKRKWFGGRSRATSEAEAGEDTGEEQESAEPPSRRAKNKRRRFSMRLAPPASEQDDESAAAEVDAAAGGQDGDQPPGERRSGRSWWRRKQRTESQQSETEQSREPEPTSASASKRAPTRQPASQSKSPQDIDRDQIDWSSLSKSERRRLRKQLKRQNRAA